MRTAAGLHASMPGEVASTGLTWRRKGSLVVSVTQGLSAVYPQLGGGVPVGCVWKQEPMKRLE